MIIAAGTLFLALTVGQNSGPFAYWTPRAGTRLEYKFNRVSENRSNKWTVPIEIVKVENGLVSLREIDLIFGLTLRGDLREPPPDHTILNSLLGGFRYPGKKLKVDETWVFKYPAVPPRGALAAEVKVTYRGIAVFEKLEVRQFTYKFLLSNGTSSAGTAWIATSDGTLLRRESYVKNNQVSPPLETEDFREVVVLTDKDW